MIGKTLLHYEITARIGAGGMGEVYRATDTALGRDVAIRLLPTAVAEDPERLARFRREAQLLASLNHPSVAAVHGLEESDGEPFLVLELVEGEDLAQRLARGRVPLDEAMEVATQIAEGLGEAHQMGIVHRDLKPGNVKRTPDGKVKILDFGLAKAWGGAADGSGSSADLSRSPTLAHGDATQAGVVLGTAAYMSPEQASGKAVDKRADIWSFGVVLFEMLVGEALFSGETASEVMAAVIKDEPDWDRLPARCPAAVTRLLRRCLRKQPQERLHDIADARLEIQEARAAVDTAPADAAEARRTVGGSRAGERTPGRARRGRAPRGSVLGSDRRPQQGPLRGGGGRTAVPGPIAGRGGDRRAHSRRHELDLAAEVTPHLEGSGNLAAVVGYDRCRPPRGGRVGVREPGRCREPLRQPQGSHRRARIHGGIAARVRLSRR